MAGFALNPPNTPIIDNRGMVTPEWYRFFAQIQRRIGSANDPLGSGQFLTLDFNDGLGAERKFTPTAGELTGVDAGADGTYTLGLADTAVTAGSYGSASNLVTITVDAKGRLTAAANVALNTDNITEGATNLFFTQARARASLSGGTGIDYNSTSGAIVLADTAVTTGNYGSATQVGTFTVDQQGRLTAASNAAIAISSSAVTGEDLTKADDTNVTLTLGGTPTGSLLNAVSITAGWTGTLAVARGGTGASTAGGALTNLGAVPTTRTATAGAGLTGGGDLSANRTFDVGAGTGITVNANDVALDTSSTRNTDHTSVTITAGTGLDGGGDISANRTIDLADTAVTPGSYTSADITVDQQGRLTAAASGASSGLWQFVETVSASAASEIDIPLSTEESYMIVLDVAVGNDGVALRAQVTTDAFSTVENGASDYRWTEYRSFPTGTTYTDTSSFADDADSFIELFNNIGNATGEYARTHLIVYGHEDSDRQTQVNGDGSCINSGGNAVGTVSKGTYRSGTVVDGLRVYASAGTVTITARVYKLVTS